MRCLLSLFVVFGVSVSLCAQEAPDGQTVFQARCVVCHKLPETVRRSHAQWAMLVDVMQQTMVNRGITQLTDTEQQALLVYLANNRSEASAEIAANPGRDTFVVRCALCHQLPEPTMLRPRQWQAILVTMQQRMQQAGVPQLTQDETRLVLEYLASQSGE